MSDRIRIVPDDRFQKWARGFEVLSSEGIGDPGMEQWELAMSLFFTATNSYIHVLSGDLKASGSKEVRREGALRIVGELSYGDEKVDYAQYELRRGGSHDFIARGLNKTTPRLERAVTDAVVQRFKELF